jgi:O-antigen ligase
LGNNIRDLKNILFQEKTYHLLNLSLPVLTGLYVFLVPMPFPSLTEICYYLALGILFCLLFLKKTDFTLRSPLTPPFVSFFLWAVFGLFFALDFQNSLHDLRGHLLEYLVVFYLLSNYFNTPKRFKMLAWTVIASATIFSIGALIQYYCIEGYPFTSRLGYYTFQEMHTDYLGFNTIFGICLALHFLFKKDNVPNKIFILSCLLVMLVTTFLTQSRGSLFGLLAALLIMGFSNKKTALIMVLITIALLFITPGIKERTLDPNAYTKDLRIKINRLTLEVIKNYPLTGIGFGMQTYGNDHVLDLRKFNSHLPPQYQQKRKIVVSPHNTILDVAVRTGVIGLFLFLSVLVVSLGMIWKMFKTAKDDFLKSWSLCLAACLISFMIPALFADTTFGPKAVVFYTILAMVNILWQIAHGDLPPA